MLTSLPYISVVEKSLGKGQYAFSPVNNLSSSDFLTTFFILIFLFLAIVLEQVIAVVHARVRWLAKTGSRRRRCR